MLRDVCSQATEPDWNGLSSGPNYVAFGGFRVRPVAMVGTGASTTAGSALPSKRIEFLEPKATFSLADDANVQGRGE